MKNGIQRGGRRHADINLEATRQETLPRNLTQTRKGSRFVALGRGSCHRQGNGRRVARTKWAFAPSAWRRRTKGTAFAWRGKSQHPAANFLQIARQLRWPASRFGAGERPQANCTGARLDLRRNRLCRKMRVEPGVSTAATRLRLARQEKWQRETQRQQRGFERVPGIACPQLHEDICRWKALPGGRY